MNDDLAEDLFGGTAPQSTQAQKIIDRFGGVPALTQALNFVGHKISRFSVYKWTYPKIRSGHGGTGGFVPATSIPWIKKAAAELGIELTKEDWAK